MSPNTATFGLYAAFGVSGSGVRAWLNRPLTVLAAHDETIGAVMRESFQASDRTYGAPRVWRAVLEDGFPGGLHRIERLIELNGLRARPRRRGAPTYDGARSVIAGNILNWDVRAERPNRIWLADVTYVWTAEGWLHVAAVLGSFLKTDRRLVDEADRDATRVMDALTMAVWRRGKADALLHHSDQGRP